MPTTYRQPPTFRRGSVLILVVALLVILALIGTAMISTSRNDRFASAQNTQNIQIDLLVEGAKSIAKSAIVDDLFDRSTAPAQFRLTVGTGTAPTSYRNYDGFYLPARVLAGTTAVPGDTFIMPRTPVTFDATLTGGPIMWRSITGPLAAGAFESPAGTLGFISSREEMYPTFYQITSGPSAGDHPALAYPDPNDPGFPNSSTFITVLAADCDGDGEADAMLQRLPMGPINGVTYYVAYRIVDNNSAVNVNTALSRDFDIAPTGATIPSSGVFQSNVGLYEMLRSYSPTPASLAAMGAEMVALNQQVTAQQTIPTGMTGTWTSPIGEGPTGNTVTTRADFNYVNVGDARQHGLARRLDNPGYVASGVRYTPLGTADTSAIASRFDLKSKVSSPSDLELVLPQSTLALDQPYSPRPSPNGVTDWFNLNFNYAAEAPTNPTMPIRALVTTRNPVSNLIGEKYASTGGLPAPEMELYKLTVDRIPHKTSINSAAFGELFRAFWCVFADPDPTVPGNVPVLANGATNTRMFRSAIRLSETSTGPVVAAADMMLIRSALAAVSAMDLRDADFDVSSEKITLSGTGQAMVFGTEPQPFITEVYATNSTDVDPSGSVNNPKGYVAVELYNPYPFDISLENWCLATIDRRDTTLSTNATKVFRPLGGTAPLPITGVTIPAYSFLVLDNFDPTNTSADPNRAQYQPAPVTGGHLFVPYLQEVMEDPSTSVPGGELVLLRPRRADGVLTAGRDFDETAGGINLADFVPVDSYDFTHLQTILPGAPDPVTFTSWHYYRAVDPATQNNGGGWKFVYPGEYYEAGNPTYPGDLLAPRWEGTVKNSYVSGTSDPSIPGLGLPAPTATNTLPYRNEFPGIQLANIDFGGPNKPIVGYPFAMGTPNDNVLTPTDVKTTGNEFPFGAFARNGDILQTAFIGGCKVFDTASPVGSFAEINPVTVDSTLARDGDPTDDTWENIGRFCPVRGISIGGGGVNDYEPNGTYNDTGPGYKYRYRFATRLFDYLTVQAPHDDYLPNVVPGSYPGTAGEPVRNSNTLALNAAFPGLNEDSAPVHGQININTANWKVMSMLPWLPAGDSYTINPIAGTVLLNPDGIPDNIQVAQAIALYRDGNPGQNAPAGGPFTSLFEIYRVPAVQTLQGIIATAANPTEPGDLNGDFSPWDGTVVGSNFTDSVRDDFEENFLLLTRVSNLVTTRSDSFTVYLIVQGWRNVNNPTSPPELVVQRRAAMVVDRSTVTPSNSETSTFSVPTQ